MAAHLVQDDEQVVRGFGDHPLHRFDEGAVQTFTIRAEGGVARRVGAQ